MISLVDGAAMQIPIEELHEPTVKWLTKMNRGWSLEELRTTMGLSSSPLPTTPKEDTNSNVTLEKKKVCQKQEATVMMKTLFAVSQDMRRM